MTFLIWSNEHSAWWRPGGMGYTSMRDQAGTYTLEEAAWIARNANRYQPRDAPPNEAMVPVDDPKPGAT